LREYRVFSIEYRSLWSENWALFIEDRALLTYKGSERGYMWNENISSMQCRALLRECGAFMIKNKSLLMENRALFIEDRALLTHEDSERGYIFDAM